MDNFHIDVVSEGKSCFELAMKLAFSHRSEATHYLIESNKRLFCTGSVPVRI